LTERVLITGAAGGMGTLLRPRLGRPGRVLRLLDVAPLLPGDGAEIVEASVTDPGAMAAACQDVDVVIHLGGHSREAPWADILSVNIDGTHTVLAAARHAGVRLVIFASSNHAVGFHPATSAPDNLFPRPDTYYGVSKVVGEALGSMYHDRYGLNVLCVRIGTCIERPLTERHLGTWLSPDDCARLFEAAIALPELGFRVVWGVSANTRGVFALDAARALGYEPRDDAEQYADDVTPASELDLTYVGGEDFCGSAADH
jgi:uronate dehydrogenase